MARAAGSGVSSRRHKRPATREVTRGRYDSTRLDTAKLDATKLGIAELVAARLR